MNTITKVAGTAAISAGIGLAVLLIPTPEPAIPSAHPAFTVPELTIPELTLPELTLPELSLPELAVPDLSIASLSSPSMSSNTIPELSIPEITIPTFDVATFEEALAVMRDKRNLESSHSPHLESWLQIYEDYATIPLPAFVAPDPAMRMITEVKLPRDKAEWLTLGRNLANAKQEGYNAVLMTFDGSESATDMLELNRFCRRAGFRVYFAFGGRERLEDTVFLDPVYYKELLQTLAAESEGFLFGWRRTSLHLFLPDPAWINWHFAILREANPRLRIFGEVYYGMTAKNHPEIYLEHNIPKNCSGVIVVNYGYSKINIENVIGKYLDAKIPELKTVPKIGVVVGDRPYYLTTNKNKLSPAQNKEVKKRLEKRFKKGGSCGTITMTDDFSDGIYQSKINNNLSTKKDF